MLKLVPFYIYIIIYKCNKYSIMQGKSSKNTIKSKNNYNL